MNDHRRKKSERGIRNCQQNRRNFPRAEILPNENKELARVPE
jgi:hypothetical protein